MKKLLLILLVIPILNLSAQTDTSMTYQQLKTKVLKLDNKLNEHINLHIQAGRYAKTASSFALASVLSYSLGSLILYGDYKKYVVKQNAGLPKTSITLTSFFYGAGVIFAITSASFNVKAKRTVLYYAKSKDNW